MSCNLCLSTADIAFQLTSTVGIEFNAKQIIKKHFSFCFADDDTTNDESVCENCWRKVKDFDDFYIYIEAYHKRPQVNVWYLTPKVEIDVQDNGETVELKECKVEPNTGNEQSGDEILGNQSHDSDNEHREKVDVREMVRVKAVTKTSTPLPKKLFPCDWCDRILKSRDALDCHYDAFHKTSAYECDLCGTKEDSKSSLKKHMKQKHIIFAVKEPVPCRICGKMLKNWKRSLTHMREQHVVSGRRLNCTYCGREFACAFKLKQHVTIHTGTTLFKCPLCDMRFRHTAALSAHKRKLHPNWKSSNNKFQCEYCASIFSSLYARASHRKTQHPEHTVADETHALENVDEICIENVLDDQLNDSNSIKADAIVHDDRKQIGIGSVGGENERMVDNQSWYDMNNDSDGEPNISKADGIFSNEKVECSLCLQQFTKNGLQRHMKWQHSTNVTVEFICDICGARYKTKDAIRRHMTGKHTYRGQPKACEICGKVLTNLMKYVAHKKHQHSEDGKNAKQCHICGRGFMDNSKLKEHISLHTDTLPLKCSLCDKRFRFSSSLSLHRKKEHPDWDLKKVEYKCHYCDNVFKTGTTRFAHIKRHHPGKIGEEWML